MWQCILAKIRFLAQIMSFSFYTLPKLKVHATILRYAEFFFKVIIIQFYIETEMFLKDCVHLVFLQDFDPPY